jgi:predicted site-specific integrase-resolvase
MDMSNQKNQEKYVSTKKASEMLGVHVLTLHNWEKAGKIDTVRTAGKHRLYNVDKYLKMQKENKNAPNEKTVKKNDGITEPQNKSGSPVPTSTDTETMKMNVCYIRVSCVGNKDILKQQKNILKNKYPNTIIVEDIGSVNNFEKHGLKEIIDMINDKSVNNIITNKGCLSKFSTDMLNYLLKKNEGGKIIVEYDESDSSTSDMIDDIIQIISSCSNELIQLKNQSKKKIMSDSQIN